MFTKLSEFAVLHAAGLVEILAVSKVNYCINKHMVNVRTLSSFCSQIKFWLSGLEITKCLSELHLQKQSDLFLCCLSNPYWQATIVQNLRTFTLWACRMSTNFQNSPLGLSAHHKGLKQCIEIQ